MKPLKRPGIFTFPYMVAVLGAVSIMVIAVALLHPPLIAVLAFAVVVGVLIAR